MLTIREAADELGVHFSTLRRWADRGAVQLIKTPGGQHRVEIGELLKLKQAMRSGRGDGAA